MSTAFLFVAIAWGSSSDTKSLNHHLPGTWELVSAEYGGQTAPTDMKEVKIISTKHFMFITYDRKTSKAIRNGTGTYTLDGDSYTEHVDFMSGEGTDGATGKDFTFKIKLDTDTLTQTGDIMGTSLKEVYRRVD
ncbi:MAG: lipocalin family protein [Acidobacteriaceae bacterium]|nr:lipocalin family protein [Acidobacteriaceae bacterium]